MILITGVSGFIAGHLAQRLAGAGNPVRGLARLPDAAAWVLRQAPGSEFGRDPAGDEPSAPIEVVPFDLLDPASLLTAAAGCRAAVHAAAWTGGPGLDRDLAWRTNVEGTANMLRAAAAAGVERFVYISSVAVYGLNRARLVDESMPTPAVGQLYPDSKVAAEALVRASGLPFVIVRPASTYGPRGDAWTLGPIRQIRAGNLVLLGRDDGLVTPGYIDNVVDGLVLALTHPAARGEAFNLCDDRAVTYRQFYMTYARMLGRDRLPVVPAWTADLVRTPPGRWARRLAGRPEAGPWSVHFRRNPSQFSVEKAARLLGYRPAVSFDEGMRRTERWLRMEGYLD